MGVLAHAIEAAGIATVAISLVRGQAESVRAPRVLHCEFPLGRPLGKPDDPAFQHDVLGRAFGLLARTDVPVLEDHPIVITDDSGDALSCTLPPRYDPSAHPAVDEAAGLRTTYARQVAAAGGRTAVGRVAGADGVPGLVGRFVALAGGASLAEAGFDDVTVRAAAHDVRAYYEEAAIALAGHVPAARRAETWLYHRTEAGAVLRAAQQALRDAGVSAGVWAPLVPAGQ